MILEYQLSSILCSSIYVIIKKPNDGSGIEAVSRTHYAPLLWGKSRLLFLRCVGDTPDPSDPRARTFTLWPGGVKLFIRHTRDTAYRRDNCTPLGHEVIRPTTRVWDNPATQ